MSINLHVENGKKDNQRKTVVLAQTPTTVTYAILEHRTTKTQYEAYSLWLRTLWDDKPDWVEPSIKDLGKFLKENRNAKFYAM